MSSNVEIEHKFLVKTDEWRSQATECSEIRTFYLACNDSMEIRISHRHGRWIQCVKSQDMYERKEVWTVIPEEYAEALVKNFPMKSVRKLRYIVPYGDLKWEIDEFLDDNAGLVIAELEVPSTTFVIDKPSWVGEDITFNLQYYNQYLAK